MTHVSTYSYEIDTTKHIEFKAGRCGRLNVSSEAVDTITVTLTMNEDIRDLFTVKADETRGRMDIKVKGPKGSAAGDIDIDIILPAKNVADPEIEVEADELILKNLKYEKVEVRGKADSVILDGIDTQLELDIGSDMTVRVVSAEGSIEVNRISNNSRIEVPEGFAFRTNVKGGSNKISYEKNGEPTDDFSDAEADTLIELAGMKSTLVIARA